MLRTAFNDHCSVLLQFVQCVYCVYVLGRLYGQVVDQSY